ncbi:hypothetical protein BH10BAC4_BH10BAC4_22460 [soil metagenome]
MIKEEFFRSLTNYSSDNDLHMVLWNDIFKNYSKSNRYYHNLTHLDSLLSELTPHKDKFLNWDVIVFSIAYHDVVYNTLKSNNEEKSGEFARKALAGITFPDEQILQCEQIILATKKHEASNFETNLFTDADLSILGSEPEEYKEYFTKIRREYSIYPDLVYNPGRRKVLIHFLGFDKIFKTSEFSTRYESKARVNLQQELDSLL